MKKRYLILCFIFSILFFSGCLREYGGVYISNIDVGSAPQDGGTKLTITPYIQNDQDKDTGVLSVMIKIKEPSTNLIKAEKSADIGYIKTRSAAANSVSLTVAEPGEYIVEVQLLEGAKILTQSQTGVTVKPRPGEGQPSDIKLTDMNLVVTKIYNDASGVMLDVSPGIFNQGGDSKSLTMEVSARVDQYTEYTKSDELGIVKGGSSVRGKVSFDIPRNKEYTFSVKVIEVGKISASSLVNEKIKLNEIKYNVPMTYILVEEGKPKPAATPKEPGFQVAAWLSGMIVVYCILRFKRKKGLK